MNDVVEVRGRQSPEQAEIEIDRVEWLSADE